MQVEKWQLGHLEQTVQKLFGFKQKILIEQPVMQGRFYTDFPVNCSNFSSNFFSVFQTQKTVFDFISKRREESRKYDAHKRVFLTNFNVFVNVVKHSFSCLIYMYLLN